MLGRWRPSNETTRPRRRREALGISIVIESVVLALLIVAPLMTSVAQPQLNRIFPPMPVVMGDWQSHNTSRDLVPHPIHHNPAFLYQDFQPRLLGAVVNSHQDAEQNADSILDSPGEYIPGAIQLTNLGPARLPVEPPSIDTHKTNEKSTVKVSEGVQQAQLVSHIEPRYPPLALSGSPWFVQAALDAVREWRYRPTYLNGEPVEVETSITVIFRLSQ